MTGHTLYNVTEITSVGGIVDSDYEAYAHVFVLGEGVENGTVLRWEGVATSMNSVRHSSCVNGGAEAARCIFHDSAGVKDSCEGVVIIGGGSVRGGGRLFLSSWESAPPIDNSEMASSTVADTCIGKAVVSYLATDESFVNTLALAENLVTAHDYGNGWASITARNRPGVGSFNSVKFDSDLLT